MTSKTIREPLRNRETLYKSIAPAIVVTLLLITTATEAQTLSAARIAAGDSHTCVITNRGGVKCWGSNTYGQLGNGVQAGPTLTPVDVQGLDSGVIAIAAGLRHTCAITAEGGVKCWGSNSAGMLGDGTAKQSSTPVDVVGLTSGVTAIAAHNYTTCAVTSNGGAKCWGDNAAGQLGAPTPRATSSLLPIDVVVTRGFTALAVGGGFVCGITTVGGVTCWGVRATLGNRPVGNNNFASVAGLINGVASIAAGNGHACAVTSAAGVVCWGANVSGQIGNGASSTVGVITPVAVVGITSNVTAVAAGGYGHSCALTSEGGVKCWGDNAAGDLGNGTTTQSNVPVNVSGLASNVIAIAAGGLHSCALMNNGAVKCWGADAEGQLGDNFSHGYMVGSSSPVDVKFPAAVTRYDLNGEWSGHFTVNQPRLKLEKVMIQQLGDRVIATKITGDEFVPAGKMTIRGVYNSNPFPIEQVCAGAEYTNPQWRTGRITVKDKNHLTVESPCAGGGGAVWERLGKITIALDDAVLFDVDSYELKADASPALEQIKSELDEKFPGSRLVIGGYTDDSGTDAHNIGLSRKRAQSVATWLESHGMKASSMTIQGYGKANPRYPNINDEARSRNRRVEIVIM